MLNDDGLEFGERVPAGYLYVDGIVGDVGQGVLRDRRVLAEEGVVVVIVCVDVDDGQGHHRPRDHHPRLGVRARGRGACSMRRARTVKAAVEHAVAKRRAPILEALEREVRRAAGKFVSERTRRRPMIVPVVMSA